MAVMVSLTWPGFSAADYDALSKIVHWVEEPAPGALYHVASFEGDTAHVTDVWNSAEEFNAFVAGRLMPAVMARGIKTQPTVTIHPAHAVWAPGYVSKG